MGNSALVVGGTDAPGYQSMSDWLSTPNICTPRAIDIRAFT